MSYLNDPQLRFVAQAETADEGKFAGGRDHLQHRGHGTQLHRGLYGHACSGQCSVDDPTDCAVGLEGDHAATLKVGGLGQALERVVPPGDKNDLVIYERGDVQVGVDDRDGNDSDLDQSCSDVLGYLLAAGLLDEEPDGWVRGSEGSDGWGQEGRGDRGTTAEDDCAPTQPEMLGDVVAHRVVPSEQVAALDHGETAGFGEFCAVAATNEELSTKVGLELLKPSRERRLADVQALGRLCNDPGLSHSHEGLGENQIHPCMIRIESVRSMRWTRHGGERTFLTMSHDHQSGRASGQDDVGVRSTSFGRVADHYETFRPGPPVDAVRWLFPEPVDTVVDVGAGTGALSRLLADVAVHVVAVEPDPDMRQVLSDSVPGIAVRDGRGEALPVADDSADGVVASSSWHWVDPMAGLREAARVLRGGGVMAAMWTGPDPDGTFMRQAQAALAHGDGDGDRVLQRTVAGEFTPANLTLEIPAGLPFASPEHQHFTWTLPLTGDQLIGLLGTLSWIIVMSDDDRKRLFDTARRFLRDVLGIEGDVTVDVDFVCDAYRARRSSSNFAATVASNP